MKRSAAETVACAPASQVHASWIELDRLRNSDGIIAIISQRRRDGVLTVAVMREFERDGRVEPTAYIPERLLESAARMLELARARCAELRTAGALPFPVRTKGRQ